MKLRKILTFMTVIATVPVWGAAGDDHITLTIRPADSHNISVEQNGDSYIITTTGNDPYVFLDADRPVDISHYRMLEFNSFNTSDILPLALFVGRLDNDHLVEGNLYTLPRTEGWSVNAYDITKTDVPADGPVSWIRIRFGMNGGNRFIISGLKLRPMNSRDRDILENIELRARQDRELSERLSCYLSTRFASEIGHVEVSYPDSTVTVAGRADRISGNAGLAEIPIWAEYTDLKDVETFIPLGREGKFGFTVPRFAEDGHDRLLSGWAVVEKRDSCYSLLSAVHYPDDIIPKSDLPEITSRSLKGIGGCPFDHEDMKLLGVGGANFNVLLDQILFTEPAAGRTAYRYGSRTWYVDENCPAIRGMDMNTKIAQENGWLISGILLLPVDRSYTPGTWASLANHPECQASAAFAMPNMLSKEGAEAYAATMTYLCERYSSGRHGRIHHWIIHNEIQNGFFWTNAGDRDIMTYMNLYCKSMRTVYNIARQFDPNAQVLISLDHDWNRKSNKRSYEGMKLMDILLDFSHKEGDFQWGIAYHPYPQDINNPRTWEDDQALYTFDTPFMTPKNLEVLNEFAGLPSVRYRGMPREIHLTEQGLNSPDYSEKSLQDQAAGMVYTWEKIRHLKNIKCYYYHLWADDHGEGGLRLGLRKFHDDKDDPLGKKPIWDVVRAYETSEWEAVREQYREILGIRKWNEILYKGEIR